MSDVQTAADRVAMRLMGVCETYDDVRQRQYADKILSHGLRELIEANEHAYQALMGKYNRQDALSEQRRLREPAALLGEGDE